MTESRSGFASPVGPIRKAFAFVRGRLKNRPDGEHEIAFNRLAISVVLTVYAAVLIDAGRAEAIAPLRVLHGYSIAAVLFFAHILWRPGSVPARRVLAMALDLAVLSYALHVGDAITAMLYPLYLWTIFGNGFRFGLRALRSAAALSVLGFALTIASTPFWRENVSLSAGLLIGLVILPAYAGTLIRKLEKARRAAEDANRAKSRFLASVSHELRTPLNAVIGMTDLLEGTELDGDQRDMARTAGDSGRVLLGMIDELLNFSRLEAGRMPTHVVDFDLHDMLASARGMLMAQAQAKHLRLSLHVTPRTPYRLRGEARQIRDVLVNLIGNAVKFTETGGVVVCVDAVGGTAERPRLRFEVADTGIGIAPEARGHIFESFTQADETIINSHGGTGLGLAICRQFVELQGGLIGVESELGVGSRFWFDLDLDLAVETAAIETGERNLAVVALAATERRAAALAAALDEAGCAAMPATDVRTALRLLREDAAARRIVVVDAEGARLDGEGLASAIRAADAEERIEVALIDPELPAGLPEIELRLLCAAAASSAGPDELRAMLRVASVGAVGRVAERAPGRIGAEPPARRLCILVAEDNRTNQKVITKILERAGHEVRVAENGELALDALTERAFDIVLMDVNMPVLDGVECVKLYRFASLGKKRVPVVALTADATAEARARCLDAGMDACLTKPIEPDRLLAMIAEMAEGAAGPALGAAEAASSAMEAVDDEIVANIARHPNFRPARRSVVDQATLAGLEELGGEEFIATLIDEFIADAALVLQQLHDAVERREPSAFREQAHALRSGAANIGARGMYEICLSYRNMDARDLAAHGAEHIRQLEAEFERVKKTLRMQVSKRDGSSGR